jgi:hypothetical protein
MAIDDITGELVWRPKSVEPGVHPVIVVVRDSSGLETKQSFSVTVQRQKTSDSGAAAPAAPASADSDAESEAAATTQHRGPHRVRDPDYKRPPIEDRTR